MADDADAVACSRCGGETEAGGLRDSWSWMKSALFRFQTWIWPAPRRFTWNETFPVHTVKKELGVLAYRCKTCGHLDLFARG